MYSPWDVTKHKIHPQNMDTQNITPPKCILHFDHICMSTCSFWIGSFGNYHKHITLFVAVELKMLNSQNVPCIIHEWIQTLFHPWSQPKVKKANFVNPKLKIWRLSVCFAHLVFISAGSQTGRTTSASERNNHKWFFCPKASATSSFYWLLNS